MFSTAAQSWIQSPHRETVPVHTPSRSSGGGVGGLVGAGGSVTLVSPRSGGRRPPGGTGGSRGTACRSSSKTPLLVPAWRRRPSGEITSARVSYRGRPLENEDHVRPPSRDR